MVDGVLLSTKICVNHTNLCKFTQIFTPGGEKNVHLCKCNMRKSVLGIFQYDSPCKVFHTAQPTVLSNGRIVKLKHLAERGQ